MGDLSPMSDMRFAEVRKARWLWICGMVFVLMLYAGLIIGVLASRTPLFFTACLVMILVLHILEIGPAMSIGRKAGFSDIHILFLTLLFGFVWWLPVKWGVWVGKRRHAGGP